MTAFSVPGYEIGDALGSSVYRAEQVDAGRAAAIKVGSVALPDDVARRRFATDARLARQLSAHPHAVEVYDSGVLPDSRPYLVLELCEGSLADQQVSPRRVAETGQQLADVLAAAHDLGLRHGAIVPEQILLKPHDTVGLAGFGLAATLDEQPTVQSDVRSLAVTLEVLLGDQAAPRELTAVLRQARENRYPDAAALRAEFSQLIVEADFSGSTPPIPVTATERPEGGLRDAGRSEGGLRDAGRPEGGLQDAGPGRRRRVLLWAAAVLAVLLVAAGVVYFIADPGADSAADSGANPTGNQKAGPGSSPEDPLGVETVAEDCPAAEVERGQAQCVATAECWNANFRPLPCDQDHVSETFAIAPVPKGVGDPSLEVLTAHPTVRQVCSIETLLASRFGAGLDHPEDRFTASVLPPTLEDQASGRDVYRCLGTVSGLTGVTGSLFRP